MGSDDRETNVPPWRTNKFSAKPILVSVGALGVFFLLLFLPVFIWFFCRIEPGSNQIAVLIRKTGEPLGPDEVIATKPGQRGVQLEVLAEGRYFRNPYTWSWKYFPSTDITAGQLGVKTRLFGKELPPGEIIAREDTRGIVADILRPGKERINPYAYDLRVFDAITIRPGSVGVVTYLVGKDVLTDKLAAELRNSYLVTNGMKGVVSEVLDPGTYYLNPYMVNIVDVNLQSQRFEMGGEDAINFLTLDGFEIVVEGTLEFGIARESAALLTHKVGDMEDVLKKIILPRARGFSRIEGSKYPANNFIVGETRQKFQDSLEKHLRENCAPWGVVIRSVLIRNIQPPDQISRVIRDREVAVQDAKKFQQQIEQAKSQAELTRQEMLATQNKEKVEQDTLRIKAVIRAQQEQAVAVTAASRELEVAKLELDAAKFQSQAIIEKAKGDGDVIRMNNEAQASVISNQASAFGGGQNLARYQLYQKLAPRIRSVVSGDGPDGLGNLLQPPPPAKKEVQP